MKYRPFGKLDWQVSALGFGAMRLPLVDNDQATIDESEAIRMIRHAIDRGVNYLDTAYVYHGGNSETLVGRALENGYREKIKLATKLPSWLVTTQSDLDRYLNEQLARLQTDHIDCYLLHGMNKRSWPKLRDVDVLEWAESARQDGRIHHLGFSFHDEYEVFQEIVDAHSEWDFCQIQYNFMDIAYQAGRKGLRYAAGKDLAVVVMEPVRGGALAKEPPAAVSELWQSAPTTRRPVDWALQWVWSQPEVAVALSGMSSMQQVEENLVSAEASGIGSLSTDEMSVIAQVREEYGKLSPIDCTNCQYCMPCPNGVNIPRILGIYNDGYIYDDHRRARFLYRQLPADQQADQCNECHECEEVCPQDLPISEWLEKCHGWLGPRT
jgi:predicted aldo/keto reductase-like oxidoreductase